MLSMLRQGNTGTEILNILESLSGEEQSEQNQPTLEQIDFWLNEEEFITTPLFLCFTFRVMQWSFMKLEKQVFHVLLVPVKEVSQAPGTALKMVYS